jgi:hypothetical protein
MVAAHYGMWRARAGERAYEHGAVQDVMEEEVPTTHDQNGERWNGKIWVMESLRAPTPL